MTEVRLRRIYGLCHPETGEIRYIGQTVKKLNHRLNGHISDHKNSYKTSWVKSLTKENLRPTIVLLEEGLWAQEQTDEIEIRWIAEGRKSGLRLTNLAEGGRADNSHQQTEAARREQSQRMKQWHLDNPDKKRQPTDYKHSDETKDLIREKSKTMWSDPEYRAKQSIKMSIGQRVRKAKANGWFLTILDTRTSSGIILDRHV